MEQDNVGEGVLLLLLENLSREHLVRIVVGEHDVLCLRLRNADPPRLRLLDIRLDIFRFRRLRLKPCGAMVQDFVNIKVASTFEHEAEHRKPWSRPPSVFVLKCIKHSINFVPENFHVY